MANKHYVPAHEDFHKGFEFEMKYVKEGWLKEVFCVGERSYGSIGHLIHAIEEYKWEDVIRVPFLTKKQLASQGWKKAYENKQEVFVHDINALCEYVMYLDTDLHKVKIEERIMGHDKVLFDGQCRCMNDLKWIMKRLGINAND